MDAVGTYTMFADPNGLPSMSRRASFRVSLRDRPTSAESSVGRANHARRTQTTPPDCRSAVRRASGVAAAHAWGEQEWGYGTGVEVESRA